LHPFSGTEFAHNVHEWLILQKPVLPEKVAENITENTAGALHPYPVGIWLSANTHGTKLGCQAGNG
jgi:hypothetical protein